MSKPPTIREQIEQLQAEARKLQQQIDRLAAKERRSAWIRDRLEKANEKRRGGLRLS